MKHKHDLPSVDADALTQLAKQFPPATARPEEAPAEQPAAPPAPPPAPAAAPRRGGGFTTFMAFLALLLAAGALAMPTLRPLVRDQLAAHPVGRFLLGPPTAAERALEALVETQRQLAAATARLDAAEAGLARSAAMRADLDAVTRLVDAITAPPADGVGEASAKWVAATDARLREVASATGRVAGLEDGLAAATARLEALDGDRSAVRTLAEGAAAEAAATGKRLDEQTAGLRDKLGTLEQVAVARMDAIAAESKTTAERLGAAIAASGEKLATAETGLAEKLAAAEAGLAGKLAAAEAGLAEKLAAAGSGVAERLAAAETALAARLETLTGAAAQADGELAGRIESAEVRLGGQVTELAARLDATAQGIGTVEGRLGGQMAELAGRLAAFEQGSAGLAERVAAAERSALAAAERMTPVEGALGELQVRFGEAERLAREAGAFARHGRLALTLTQVTAAADTHRPFAGAVNAALALAGPDDALRVPLNVLGRHAETGVATVAELRDSFSVILAPKLESLTGNGDPSWSGRVRSWLSTLVAPVGMIAPEKDPVAEALAKANENLAAEDLGGAVAALEKLDGPAATLTSRWLAEARARLALIAARDALTGALLDLLAKG